MKIVIINVGVGGWHPKGSQRLGDSIASIHPELWESQDIQFMSWTTEYPVGSPTHQQAPYGFKPYAFLWAIENNYDIAIWADSAVWPKKSIHPLIDIINKQGHLLFQNGWTSGEWMCDNQMEALGLTRDEALQIPHLMACVMGFDLRNERSIEFLKQWISYTKDFLGEWTNTGLCSEDKRVLGSRHDQTFASVISHRLGMDWTNPKGLVSYDINEDSILVTQGM